MPRFFKIKRLKIAEQILIILVFAVVIPMTISAFIINNINQQAVRAQLVNSAILIANMISESADIFVEKDLSLEVINKKIFKTLKDDERQIYIISTKNNQLILSHNFTQSAFDSTMKVLPKKLKTEEAVVFSKIKNQPLVYIKKDNPEILIIVNTTKEITKRTITKNSARIILSTIIAALMVIFIVGIYTYYLYINIRQLFKGIIAISKGSYGRRIRLLTNAFTPYEVVFLAFEFNKMSLKIKHSYQELKKANKELKKMNEFRSNMIDTVSHEFRTPLTSIQGYTSRLLRQDIQIDEDTKQKSLYTIKRQSERLSRMIEDLLVIPDIEGSRIRISPEKIWLNDIITSSIMLVKNTSKVQIENNIPQDIPNIIVDKDRFEQVLVNLIENAVKYSAENDVIRIEAKQKEDKVKIFVKNNCEIIPKDKLNSLFEKFTRIDDKTTRTTRGTGLGLFIVKGLVEAMDGKIKLHSSEECGFCVELTFKIAEG